MRRNRAKKGPSRTAQRPSDRAARGVFEPPRLQKIRGFIAYICCLVYRRSGSEDVRKRVEKFREKEKEKERKKIKKNVAEPSNLNWLKCVESLSQQ